MFKYRKSLVLLLVLVLLVSIAGSALAGGNGWGKNKWDNGDDGDDDNDRDLPGYGNYKKGKDPTWGWAVILIVRAAGLEDEAQQADPGSFYRYVPSSYHGYNLRKYLKVALAYNLIESKEVRKFEADKRVPSSILQEAFARIAWMLMNNDDNSPPPATQPTVYEGAFISVTSGNPPVLGIQTGDGQIRTFNVASNVTVTYGSTPLTLASLAQGDSLKITVKNGAVTTIVVTARLVQTASGTIANLQTISGVNYVTIQPSSGQAATYPVKADADITFGQNVLSFAELRVGDQGTLQISSGQVIDILVLTRVITQKTGTVANTQTTTGKNYLTFQESGTSQAATYRISATASIKYQNQTIAFTDLRAGDTVNLKLAGDLINEITVTARAVTQYTGTITGLQNSGGVNLINLTTSQQTLSLALTANAEIKYGTVLLYFGELRVGDSATVELSNNQVTRVTVAPRADGLQLTRSGTVVALNGPDSTVTVNVPASGSVPAANVVLKVDSQTSIVRGGVAIGLGDLRYGQSVTYTAKLVGDQWKALTIQADN